MNLTSSKKKLVIKDRLFQGLHFGLRSLLPISVFLIVVSLEVPTLAYVLVLLSKWRILAAKPRFWWPNLKSNAVDLVFSLSLVLFISWPTLELGQQLIWLAVYCFWIFGLKSPKIPHRHTIRALAAQCLGSSALIYSLDQLYLPLVLFGIWLVSILSVQHALSDLPKEKHHSQLIHIWGLFSIQLAWVLLHWQVNFWVIPNLVILQLVLLAALITLHALYCQNALSKVLNRQILISTLIVVAAVLFLSGLRSASL